MSDEEISNQRRKVVSNILPLLISSIFQAEKIVSPTRIAGQALDQYDDVARRMLLPFAKFIKEKFPDLVNCKLSSDSPDRFELLLDRKDVVEGLVEPYLRARFAKEGGFISHFGAFELNETVPHEDSFDGVLVLQAGSVYVKLLRDAPQPRDLPSLQASASKLNSFYEVWLVVTSGMSKSQEESYVLDSSYLTESNFLVGRLMVLGLNNLISELLKSDQRYVVQISSTKESEGFVRLVFVQPPTKQDTNPNSN